MPRTSVAALSLPAVAACIVVWAVAAPAAAQICPECEAPTVVDVGNNAFVGSATGCLVPAGACLVPSNNTQFFAFTPPASGAYRISTCLNATAVPLTVLSVWTGCGEFELVTCGVAGCPSGDGAGSLIGKIDLEAGFTYRIGVGAICCGDDFIESGVLTIEPIDPPGSGCADATEAFVGLNAYDTSERTEVVDLEGWCAPWPSGEPYDGRLRSVQYFRFTPPATGTYSLSTCVYDETVDEFVWERLAVMAGCSPSDGVIACSDSGCYSNFDYTGTKIVAVDLVGGVEYTILLGGVTSSSYGVGFFSIEPYVPCEAPKANRIELEACGADENSACFGTLGSEPIALGDSVRGTLWAAGGASDADWYLLDLPEGTEVKLELRSVVPAFATFYELNCTSSLFTDQTSGLCPGLTDGQCLPAGRHYVVVAPYEPWGFPCGYPGGNDYVLTVTGAPCDASPPPNDLCADAIEVAEGATPFDNLFAGTDVSAPTCGLIGRDVWFSFTATKDGDHRVATCGGTMPFNSAMDVWTACPEKGGEVLACNLDAGDQSCGSGAAGLIATLEAGQTVLIRVGSEWFFDFLPPGDMELAVEFLGDEVVCGDPDAGACCVARTAPFCSDIDCCNFICIVDPACCDASWDETCAAAAALYCYVECGLPPENGDCGSAQPATLGANRFRNVRAEGATPSTCGTIHFDVWYEFAALGDGNATISFCDEDGGWALVTGGGSGDVDLRIAVFDGCDGTPVACTDGGCGLRAKVTFPTACGATYLIAIGSSSGDDGLYDAGVGSFVLSQSGSCGDTCPADLDGDGTVGALDLAALLAAWGSDGAADLDGDGAVGALDLAALLAAWGSCSE